MADYRKVFGRIVTDAEGAVGGVSVTVYQTGTTTKITLKDNKAGTEALANPFDTDANGVWAFFTDIEALSGYDYEVDVVFEKSGLGFSVMNEMYENITMPGAPSSGAVVDSDFDATTLLYATLDNTPVATTPTEFMAVLSGEAAAAFAWNSQDLTGIKDLTAQNLTDSALTTGRVVLAGTAGILEDTANLTWSGTQFDVTGNLYSDGENVSLDGNTSSRIFSAGFIRLQSPSNRIGVATGVYMEIATTVTSGITTITHQGSAPTVLWTVPAMTFTTAFEVIGATTLVGLTISGDTDSAGKLDFQFNPLTGSATGHIIKATLTTATDYNGTTAGLIVKNYFADNACTVTGGELTGLYVNVKQLAVLTGAAKSSLISAHNYGTGGDYQSIDYGVVLYGDLTAGFELTGGTSDYGIKMGSQIISVADIQLSSGALIQTGAADPNGSVTGTDGSGYFRTGTATATTILYVCTGTTNWTALGGGAGGGDVYVTGTPVDSQIAIWTSADHIEGDTNFQWDGSAFMLLGTQFIKEQSEAAADKAGYGQLWVNTAVPSELWFTGDTGVDVKLVSLLHTDIAGEIVAIAEKTAPIGVDEFLIEDSAASDAKKSVKLSNLGADAGIARQTTENVILYCAYTSGSDASADPTSSGTPYKTIDKVFDYIRDNFPLIVHDITIRMMELETITTEPDTSGIYVLGTLTIEGHNGVDPLHAEGTCEVGGASTTVNIAAGDVPTDDVYNGGYFWIYESDGGMGVLTSSAISDCDAGNDTVTIADSISTDASSKYALCGIAGLYHASGTSWKISTTLGKIALLGIRLENIIVYTVSSNSTFTNCYWDNSGYAGCFLPGNSGVCPPMTTIIKYCNLISKSGNNTISSFGNYSISFYYSISSGGNGIRASYNGMARCYSSNLSHSGNTSVEVSIGGKVSDYLGTCTSVGTVTETAASFGWTDFVTA